MSTPANHLFLHKIDASQVPATEPLYSAEVAKMIEATFRDGPLAGQSILCDLEKHTHADRKTGAHYIRQTEYTAGNVVSYFVLRETAYKIGQI